DTLILFDEIQEAPGALTCLKYFYENAPQYHVIAAGSLLEAAPNGTGFPVGMAAFLELRPLTFIEFIEAIDERPSSRRDYADLLKQYFYVGGMPAAVNAYAQDKNFEVVRGIQKDILDLYERDLAAHPRIRETWQSIPKQLAKENKKFFYNLIRE